jgi:hypothetical protein
MSDASSFNKLVPGFDFLQSLVKNAGAAIPGVGQWVAPTLDPAELDKRIGELRTVQFWLEQNARMLAATIQALEVQRMTLSTLKTMNVRIGDLRDSLTLKPPAAAAPAASTRARKEEAPPAGVVDPMQWWGALTGQFAQLAAAAMKDGAADSATSLAAKVVQQSIDGATATLRQAAAAPGKMADAAGKTSTRPKVARKRGAARRTP